jgi:hypothetical protein
VTHPALQPGIKIMAARGFVTLVTAGCRVRRYGHTVALFAGAVDDVESVRLRAGHAKVHFMDIERKQ